MIRILLSLCLFLACAFSLRAQTATDSIQKGVDADPRLQTLVNKHVDVNEHVKEKGYRVQIYFGGDKTKANEVKARFLASHSETHAYEMYDLPNFKIRVGNFRTRMEAYRYLKKIRSDFPSAFIVESEIDLSVE